MLGCYKVTQSKQIGYTWGLPVDLMKLLMLNENDEVALSFGSKTVSAQVCRLFPGGRSNAVGIGFSPSLLKALHIPDTTVLSVKPKGNKHFHLGPLIGILTYHSLIANKRLGFYKTYAELNKNNGLLYVFSGRDINLLQSTIKGYYYDFYKGTWNCQEFPFPDIVIDRCYPNNYTYHTILEKVIGPDKIFNKKNRIDKVDFSNTLTADAFLKEYIPDSREYRKISDLELFLRKYNQVYLKPSNSMKGFGIVVVKHISESLLECNFVLDGENTTRLADCSDDGISGVLECAAGCKRQYIVQQSVSSLEYKNGPFSIRTWAMKDGNGQWVMPGMCARGSFGRGFLTNFSAGAKAIPLKNLFDEILPLIPLTKEQLINLLENLTLKSAIVLDKKFGPLGVLGFDIMIDQKGKPWLIEVNGNPGKKSISLQPEYPSWHIQAYQYPLAYASYLAGFNNTKFSDESTVQNQKFKEKLIKALVIIGKKTVTGVSVLEIAAPVGVGIDHCTGNLTASVRLEKTGEPVLKTNIINNKVINEGFIPFKLILDFIKPESCLNAGREIVQQVYIPFQSVIEFEGIKPGDDIQKQLTVESASVMGIPDACPPGLAGSKAKLRLNIVFNLELVISRQSIISVPARICEIIS